MKTTTKSADIVFKELGEMFDFLRTLQRTRNPGESDDAYRQRQKRLVRYAMEYPSNSTQSLNPDNFTH